MGRVCFNAEFIVVFAYFIIIAHKPKDKYVLINLKYTAGYYNGILAYIVFQERTFFFYF